MALDVVDQLSTLKTPDDLIDALERSFRCFGLDHFVITGLPSPHERFEKVVLLRRWPPGWFELYSKSDFVRSDPVIKLCRATTSPFEWSEAPFDEEREPQAGKIMNLARDFGMPRGFSLPVHGVNGYEACFSVSGPNPDLSSRTKPALHLIAMYGFERARQLMQPSRRLDMAQLTAREREVLTWAAVGKTGAETAEIMAITQRTVTSHIINATCKLGAANKTQAVVRAMQANLIRI